MPITGLREMVIEQASAVAQAAAEALLAAAIEAAPEDTGETKASGFMELERSDDTSISYRIGFTTPQATFTNDGTAPHEIRAVNASALRFFWENGPNGAGVYYFQHVNHPGFEGTHWFDDVADRWDEFLSDAARA